MSVTTGGVLAKNWLPLSRSKPAQEQCKWVTDQPDMTLAVDRAVKPQHKQIDKIDLLYTCPVYSGLAPYDIAKMDVFFLFCFFFS